MDTFILGLRVIENDTLESGTWALQTRPFLAGEKADGEQMP